MLTIHLSPEQHNHIVTLCGSWPGLVKAMEPVTKADPSDIELARDRHAWDSDNEIEIDNDAVVSHGDDGRWISAWVWLPASVQPESED